MSKIEILPLGVIESPLKSRAEAPRQGQEARVKGKIIIKEEFKKAVKGLKKGDYIWVLCWFQFAKRDILEVHPRMAKDRGLTGVFCSRSPDRPNPIGLDLVKILDIEDNVILVEGLDALNGTPVLDIKLHFPSIDCPKKESPLTLTNKFSSLNRITQLFLFLFHRVGLNFGQAFDAGGQREI